MIKLDKVNWGFIGCGEVTEKKSGPAFNMIEGSRVVAVMSRDEEKAKSYAIRHQIPPMVHRRTRVNWRRRCECHLHRYSSFFACHICHHAMKAGKPVYIEKPMAASYEDCARINRISKETGVPCFVAYYRRYLPYFQKVRQLVEEGEIGNVINVQIRFAQPPARTRLQQQEFAMACATRYCRWRLFLRPGSPSTRFIAGHVRMHPGSRRIQM